MTTGKTIALPIAFVGRVMSLLFFVYAKVGSQDIPGVTGKFGLGEQNEPGQGLTEFCQKIALVTVNILLQLHKRQLYTWTSPNGQYRNHINYILCSQRWRSMSNGYGSLRTVSGTQEGL